MAALGQQLASSCLVRLFLESQDLERLSPTKFTGALTGVNVAVGR